MDGPAIIKDDGRREPFDAKKLRLSMDRALHKRPVSEEEVEAAVRAVVHHLRMTAEREVSSRRVGEFVIGELRKLDKPVNEADFRWLESAGGKP